MTLTKISRAMLLLGGNSMFNVTDYGAVGDGITDDTISINTAISAAIANGGGTIYFPMGKYLVSDTISIANHNIYLAGDGMYLSVIYRTGNYGNTVEFIGDAGSGAPVSNIGVRDLCFQSNGLTTSGSHILFDGATRVQCSGIFMLQGFVGMTCKALTAAHIDNWYLVFTDNFGGTKTDRAYLVCGENDAYSHPSCGDVFFDDINLRGNTAQISTDFGIIITSADGLWFNGGHVASAGLANLAINHGTHSIALVWFDTVMFDEGQGTYNVIIQGADAGSLMAEIHFDTCSIKGIGVATYGVVISGDARCVYFDSCVIMQHLQYGVLINTTSAQQIRFKGCFVAGNSMAGSGAYAGMNIAAANTAGIFVNGGKFGGDGQYSSTGFQSYGIQIAAGADNIIVDGVDLRGNITGTLANASSGTSIKVVNCLP